MTNVLQVWPLIAGVGAAGAIIGGRAVVHAFQAWKAKGGPGLLSPRFYEGGFEKVMNKREAARILGIR